MAGEILGLHHIKMPVSDLVQSRDWYERVFDLTANLEWPDADGVVRGVAYNPLQGLRLSLRENPELASAMRGYDPFVILVAARTDVEWWGRRLDELGVDHSPVVAGALGSLITFDDPDGIQLKIYSEELHGKPRESLRSRARPAT